MRNDPGLERDSLSVRQQKRLYDQAARLAHFGAWECDLATEDLTWTDGVHALFELPVGTPLKRATIVDLYVGDSRHDMEIMRAEAIRTRQGFTLDAQIRTCRGEHRWMRISADVECEAGRPVRIFGAKQDITRERAALERLRELAENDPLTGLANRRLFEARYCEVIGDTLNYGFVSALVLIDIDHFKAINDRLGHAAGDECLRQIAMRLRQIFADAGLVARIGGDEFAVLLRAPVEPTRIAQVLRLALAALRKPILWNMRPLDVGASIGARILAQPHGRRSTEFFAEADAALYAAKAAGRNVVCIFGEDGVGTNAIGWPIEAAGVIRPRVRVGSRAR